MAPHLDPEQIVPSKDGWMDPTTEAAHLSALEPNTDSASKEIYVSEPRDLFSVVGPGPHASMPIESDWAPVMEFTVADIFHHSPFGDVLNSLRSLSLCQEIPGRTISGLSGARMTKKIASHPPPTSLPLLMT